MNEETFQPRKGFYVEGDTFKGFGGWSFTISFNKKLVQHSMDGYENGVTHEGFKTEFFVMLFNRTYAFGYNSVQPIKL